MDKNLFVWLCVCLCVSVCACVKMSSVLGDVLHMIQSDASEALKDLAPYKYIGRTCNALWYCVIE